MPIKIVWLWCGSILGMTLIFALLALILIASALLNHGKQYLKGNATRTDTTSAEKSNSTDDPGLFRLAGGAVFGQIIFGGSALGGLDRPWVIVGFRRAQLVWGGTKNHQKVPPLKESAPSTHTEDYPVDNAARAPSSHR